MKKLCLSFIIGLTVITIAVLTVSVFRGDSPDLITSDGNAYYAWLTTLVIDHDLDFYNDFEKLYAPDPVPGLDIKTDRGLTVNKCPIGMAIVELPGFFLAHVIAIVTPFPVDGVSPPYQIIVAGSLALFYIVGICFFYRAMVKFGCAKETALFFSVMAIAATNIIHYLAKEPAMTHATNATIAAIILLISVSKK